VQLDTRREGDEARLASLSLFMVLPSIGTLPKYLPSAPAGNRALGQVRQVEGSTMRHGIHLPHAGEQAEPGLLRRFALEAEGLGLDDVWVSEHIIVPRDKFPRSPLFYDPVLTLTWVAAVTKRIRLGTSVLVLPMRHPLPLAKELATLHNLSDGRLILALQLHSRPREYI